MEKIADLNELPDGGRKSIIIDDTPALLLRIGNDYYCLEDRCSHDGQPLTDGAIVAHSIECPRHGARFDLASGAALCMPATQPIRAFQVEIRDDGIYSE